MFPFPFDMTTRMCLRFSTQMTSFRTRCICNSIISTAPIHCFAAVTPNWKSFGWKKENNRVNSNLRQHKKWDIPSTTNALWAFFTIGISTAMSVGAKNKQSLYSRASLYHLKNQCKTSSQWNLTLSFWEVLSHTSFVPQPGQIKQKKQHYHTSSTFWPFLSWDTFKISYN